MKFSTLALASVLALGAAGGALAQTGPAPGPAPQPGLQGERHWQRPDPAQVAERRAQRLRDALQLRPDQEPALRAFLDAHGRGHDGHRLRGERQPGPARQALTTPERLDRMAARLAERQTRFQQKAAATKRFYAQLSPSQQRAFDALHQGRGHRGERGGREGHRGHGGRGGFGGPAQMG